MPSSKNIVELRSLLAEKFPGLKTSADLLGRPKPLWPTGWAALDESLGGGLARGEITEFVAGNGGGSASLIRQLIERNAANGNWTALIDGQESFDPSGLKPEALGRLLWARSRGADRSLKCADILLRDRNFNLVILDLALVAPDQLRRISSSVWHRLQRLAEAAAAILATTSPRALAAGARARLALRADYSIRSLLKSEDEILGAIRWERLDSHLAQQAIPSAG